jgi:RNA polymerase sigma factor (sigma-70 family)
VAEGPASAIRCDRSELDALRAGVPERWEAWMQFLYRVARARFRLSPENTDEVVQQTLLQVWNAVRRDTIREPAALVALVLAALRNEFLQARRRAGRVETVSLDTPPKPDGPSPSTSIPARDPSPEEILRLTEMRALVGLAIARICKGHADADRDQRIGQMLLLDSLKPAEVAARLGIDASVVYSASWRLRRALADCVAEGEAAGVAARDRRDPGSLEPAEDL